MKKHVPYEKLSKKAQRARDLMERAHWGDVRPVTRRIESGKAYSRKKDRRIKDDDVGLVIMYKNSAIA